MLLYKKKVRGEERSLGMKNMLDHLKQCLPAPASAHASLLNRVTSGSNPGQWVIQVSGTDPVSTLILQIVEPSKLYWNAVGIFR